MPAGDLLPPEGYTWWVPALAVGLVVAAGVWFELLRRLATRRDREGDGDVPEAGPELRPRYAAAVEELHDRYRAGELDLRGLHLGLAALLREFASARLGRDVRGWTRARVAAHDPTRRLGSLLATWEEPSFAVRSDAEADAAVTRAREVVERW